MLFFMSCILDRALELSLPSNMLHIVVAKISRRALKLGMKAETAWFSYVQKTVDKAQLEMTGRWSLTQQLLNEPVPQLGPVPSKDSQQSLTKLRPYLATVEKRIASPVTCDSFVPECNRRILHCDSALPDRAFMAEVGGDKLRLNLADLENWASDSLGDWTDKNVGREGICLVFADLISGYAKTSSLYMNSPEDQSLMIFTTMELWVALDQCAISECPLLREYDPGFPIEAFEPLLLPTRSQMERVLHVEQYLTKRRHETSAAYTEAFQTVGG